MPATDQYLRNISKVHVVFCLSAIALTAATALMLYRDHDDEWRDYQRAFVKADARILEEERAATLGVAGGSEEAYNSRRDELKARAAELTAELSGQNTQYQTLTAELAELNRAYDLKGRDVRAKRAERDVARANLDLGIRDAVAQVRLDTLEARFRDEQAQVEQLELDWEELGTARKAKQSEVSALTADRDAVEAEVKRYTADITRIDESLDRIQPGSVFKRLKRDMMEWPIIDGFNSHQKVVQDWMPDLKVTLGMTHTARFDRCRTCHQGIARFAAGNVPTFSHGDPASDDPVDWVAQKSFPHPYSSHPRPDVYLTAASPHPIADFGCTVCHDGTGSATSFHNAQHGPNDPVQEHEWHEKYGYSHNHFWEYPMQPERLRELTCLKCHHDVVELGVNPTYGATAPKAYEGWQLIRQYGCFGCHEINGFDGGKRIGPDLRLEPTEEERPKYASDPNMIPGQMRKVGPSLKHVAQKTSANWIAEWTREPKKFRPETRMPQFFGLSNLQDHYGADLSAVEIASVAHFLVKQSTDIEMDKPANGYLPDAERGRTLFAERGCLACHKHDDPEFAGVKADFGPNLTKTALKLLPGPDGFNWVYTWIRDPQRYHSRSRMPNLFLETYEGPDGAIDPAADIAAFLVGDGPSEWAAAQYDDDSVKELARLHLAGKALTRAQFDVFWETRVFPIPRDQLKGDEIELSRDGDTPPTSEEWQDMLLNYLGRRSVNRYGCYGCHDINGFGESRPIGTALQDWGRKDPGRLALEHIEEFLHHHGQPDGSSTAEYVEGAITEAAADAFDSEEERDASMRTAFFYDSLIHHGRPGFIFQKLRDPRSYDYEKTATKGYAERLVMPKFPLDEVQIEAISTFVLGLVAEPPAARYVYQPDTRINDRNQGEILLQKYNCTACHLTDMHRIEYAVEEGDLAASDVEPGWHQFGLESLLKLRPPVPAYTGRTHDLIERDDDGKETGRTSLPTVQFRGLLQLTPDPDEEDPDFRTYTFTTWEPASLTKPGQTEDGGVRLPGSLLVIPETRLANHTPAQTGQFAEWLVQRAMPDGFDPKLFDTAWQSGPPPLFHEGDKVQTDWLYRFLKDPGQIRYTIKLRMPRFNMSDDEARTLANYFAAADGAEYPYQEIPQAEPEYLAAASSRYAAVHPDRATQEDYLQESWRMLSTTLCIKCHAVGGREFKAVPNDPNVTRGPNLDGVSQRLRSEWLTTWLSNPKWITPYTSMPLPFPKNQTQYAPLFDADGSDQTLAVRDALLNYHRLLERNTQPLPPAEQPAPAVPAAN